MGMPVILQSVSALTTMQLHFTERHLLMNRQIRFVSFDDKFQHEYLKRIKSLLREKTCLCIEGNQSQSLDNFPLMNRIYPIVFYNF